MRCWRFSSFSVISGVIALGGAVKQGPLAFALSFAAGRTAREIHELLAFALLAMIAAHWAGVAFESWRLRENLVRAMFTGRKSDGAASSEPPASARPAEAATIVLGIAAIAVPGGIALSQIPAKGVPTRAAQSGLRQGVRGLPFCLPAEPRPCRHLEGGHGGDGGPFWRKCHSRSREGCEHSGLADRQCERALGYASREHAPPRERSRSAKDHGSTQGWARVHEDIPDSVFRSKAVGAKGACKACHSDAETARFDPQSIAIPKEVRP